MEKKAPFYGFFWIMQTTTNQHYIYTERERLSDKAIMLDIK